MILSEFIITSVIFIVVFTWGNIKDTTAQGTTSKYDIYYEESIKSGIKPGILSSMKAEVERRGQIPPSSEDVHALYASLKVLLDSPPPTIKLPYIIDDQKDHFGVGWEIWPRPRGHDDM